MQTTWRFDVFPLLADTILYSAARTGSAGQKDIDIWVITPPLSFLVSFGHQEATIRCCPEI